LESVVLIPSLNPDDKILELVRNLRELNINNIVIVNDGSCNSCLPVFDKLERDYNCTVISHEKNMGKGAALKTGIDAINKMGLEIAGYVTADADGQHSPNDIAHIAEVLNKNPSSLILGVRDFNKKNVPFKSRYGNKITSLIFLLTSGRRCSDTQTGLRGIPFSLTDELLKISGQRFEYETNMLIQLAKKKINFIEIPIETIYSDNNRESHFRPFRDSLLIYGQIVKFTCSSLLSAMIDLTLFTVFHITIFSQFNYKIIYSTIAARILSGIINYIINKKVVFKNDEKNLITFLRYAAMFFTRMALSSVSVHLLAGITNANETLFKIIVDTILFFFGFIIQKIFVFKPTDKQ
jgi:putative flippase GtrA